MNVLRDNNQTYSIIHLEDSADIACKIKMNDVFKDELICLFHGKALQRKKAIENRFFKIDFTPKMVKITPKYKLHYYPFKKSFIKDDVVDGYKGYPVTHWIVVGFKKDSTLYTEDKHEGLAFPIQFSKQDLPSIGELNFDLNPMKKNQSATSIAKIKEAYDNKQYEKVLKETSYLLEEKTLFTSDAKLYKIRALDKIINTSNSKAKDDGLDPEMLIELSLEWIDENPSDDQLAEMYMYVAKTYLNIGRASKAKRYLDILDDEYKTSPYNFMAKLANADRIYKAKSKDDAIKVYKEVLYATDDFDIASMAALKLSKAYVEKKKIQKAKEFIQKVISANEPFIQAHPTVSYALAKTFADNNESNISVAIASSLQKDMQHNELNEDELKKNIAYWHEKSQDTYGAISLYKQYLEEQKYGKYRDFVSERLDKVMLSSDEGNETKKLAQLDTIMQKYKEDAIYAKALLAKADIYLKNNQLESILQMKGDLQKYGGEALLGEVAKKLLAKSYHDKECKKAISLESEYNLTVQTSQQEQAFDCYSEENMLEKALQISREKMQSKDLEERLKWSYRSAKIYQKLGKYKALILVADDVDKLQKLVKIDKYNDLIYDKIMAYYHLGGYDDLMLREVKRVEKLFPENVKNLDVFEKVLNFAKKHRDHSLIINYAKKMSDLQEKYHLETYTPKLQLDYIEALREKARYKLALDEDIKLLYKKLNDTQRAHVLYIAGDLSEKFKKMKEAKEFYTKCGEIVENSAWVELCSENLQLLEE